jgi:hypothetical protein
LGLVLLPAPAQQQYKAHRSFGLIRARAIDWTNASPLRRQIAAFDLKRPSIVELVAAIAVAAANSTADTAAPLRRAASGDDCASVEAA